MTNDFLLQMSIVQVTVIFTIVALSFLMNIMNSDIQWDCL